MAWKTWMNCGQWPMLVSLLCRNCILQCFVLPSVSLVLPCGSGGQLWSQDNYLIITIAERRTVVIFDGLNKEVYVNTPNECKSSVFLAFFSSNLCKATTCTIVHTFPSYFISWKKIKDTVRQMREWQNSIAFCFVLGFFLFCWFYLSYIVCFKMSLLRCNLLGWFTAAGWIKKWLDVFTLPHT